MKMRPSYIRQSSFIEWLTFIFILLILLLFLVVTAAKGQNISNAEIDKMVGNYMSNKNNRALVVGIIKNGQQQIFTFGETEKGSGLKPDSKSVFEIGTVSEVFTTSLLAILESKGKVSSLDPVSEILKGVVKVPYYQRIVCEKPPLNPTSAEELMKDRYICFPDPYDVPQLMVLCDLATHSAGFPEEPDYSIFNGKNPYTGYTIQKLNKYIASLPPNQAFGYQYNHSMIGIALLGEALSKKTGKDYNTLLNEEIFTPLSMMHTFITPNAEQAQLFLKGHTTKGNPTIHRDYNAFIPAAGIRTNAPDLLHFLKANLSTKTNNLEVALSETFIPRLYADPADNRFMVGWGWIVMPVSDKNKHKMVWQCSEKGGFASFIGFVKESQTAVVVLSNTPNSVDDMGMKILKLLEPSDPKQASLNIDIATFNWHQILAKRKMVVKDK